MTPTLERKIEAALEKHLHDEGWSIDVSGDHIAERFVSDTMGGGVEITINLTECAKSVALELAR